MQTLQYPLTLSTHCYPRKHLLVHNGDYHTRLIIIIQTVIPEARAVHDAASVPHRAAIQ